MIPKNYIIPGRVVHPSSIEAVTSLHAPGFIRFKMGHFVDLSGRVFGGLTAIKVVSRKPTKWECVCECGNYTAVHQQSLMRGDTKSCGCRRSLKMTEQKTIHGHFGSLTYRSWASMKSRCMNEGHRQYKDYGGRGISVCPEWMDFSRFLSDMGERPSIHHQIDRIDNNSGYSPENCRWATRKENAANKRNTVRLTDGERKMTTKEWADQLSVSVTTLNNYIKRNQLHKVNLTRV